MIDSINSVIALQHQSLLSHLSSLQRVSNHLSSVVRFHQDDLLQQSQCLWVGGNDSTKYSSRLMVLVHFLHLLHAGAIESAHCQPPASTRKTVTVRESTLIF